MPDAEFLIRMETIVKQTNKQTNKQKTDQKLKIW